MLREVVLAFDSQGAPAHDVLSRTSIRASSAYEAALGDVDTGEVGKVVVQMTGPGSTRNSYCVDSIQMIEVPFDLTPLVALDADERAARLLRVLHEEVRRLAKGTGWDVGAFDSAFAAAVDGGVVARMELARAWHRTRRWYADAAGWVDEDGVHLDVSVVDARTEAQVAEGGVTERGDWHRLWAARRLRWSGDTVSTVPAVRAGIVVGPRITVVLPSSVRTDHEPGPPEDWS